MRALCAMLVCGGAAGGAGSFDRLRQRPMAVSRSHFLLFRLDDGESVLKEPRTAGVRLSSLDRPNIRHQSTTIGGRPPTDPRARGRRAGLGARPERRRRNAQRELGVCTFRTFCVANNNGAPRERERVVVFRARRATEELTRRLCRARRARSRRGALPLWLGAHAQRAGGKRRNR